MYIKELDKIGIMIDTFMAIIISVLILSSISWLLEITGNSFYTILVTGYAAVILLGGFAFIESFWGPVIIQFLYRDQILAIKKQIETLQNNPIQYKIRDQEHTG